MSRKSNDNGRAYEFAYLILIEEMIGSVRRVNIERNSSFYASKNAWDRMSELEKHSFTESARAGIDTILELEPLILEENGDILTALIQPDSEGEVGDVRDIILTRDHISWTIGLSVKNNHFAVKHSRLSHRNDFAKSWFGIECSPKYWSKIKPIFDYLKVQKDLGEFWRNLPNKSNDVYIPLLKAFILEVQTQYLNHGSKIPTRMVEYLLGNYDFYKLISLENKKITQTHTYNLRGSLNKAGSKNKPKIIIPRTNLPSRIIAMDFKPNSDNTVELYLDEGWSFSFRIHNASSKVEPSLKFDVQIIGMPSTILVLNTKW